MKHSIEDLYVFGGQRAFATPRHVGKPNPVDRQAFLQRVNRILDTHRFTNSGPFAQEFEQRLAERTGVRHCVVTCNGTTALQIAARALDLEGEVIMPSFTFAATAHALEWQHITPVFCDIDPQTCTIDPDDVSRNITPLTSGILAVHLFGQICKIDKLQEIARRHGLPLIFDACHAFGCSHQGTMIGNFGDAEVFSFHTTKFVNSFEGGAVATNNDELAEKMRLMRNFGSVDLVNVVSVGTNGKLSEIAAAMGLTSLEGMDRIIAANRENYEQYGRELARLPGVSVLPYPENENCNYQYIVIRIDQSLAGLSRDHLFYILRGENILVQRYFYPGVHNVQPYRSRLVESPAHLPNTERMTAELLALPTGLHVTAEDIRQICEVIGFLIEQGREIELRLTENNHRQAI